MNPASRPPATLPATSFEAGDDASRTGMFAALLALVLLYLAWQHQPFAAPNNDYDSFEHIARAFAAGDLPTLFKRGPILPALMAALAPFLGPTNPFLHAALWWNLCFGIGLLAVMWAIARRTIGGGGLVAVLLLATTPQWGINALRELVEPSLGFFVALTFLLHLRRSPWKWAAAAAALLSRTEAGLLLPVLVLADALEGMAVRPTGDHETASALPPRARWTSLLQDLPRHLAPPVLFATLALLPFLLWTLLAWRFDSGADSYSDMLGADYWTIDLGFLERAIREPFFGWYRRTDPLRWAIIALPVALGLVDAWRRWRRALLPMLLFAAGTIATIVAFGASKPRYTYTTSWILLLLFTAGVLALMRGIVTRWPRGLAGQASAAILAILSAIWLAGRLSRGADQLLGADASAVPVAWDAAFAALCLLLLAGALWRVVRATRPTPTATQGYRLLDVPPWAAWLVGLCLCSSLVTGGVHGKQRGIEEGYWDNHESALAARWLADHLGPDERVVLPFPSHAQHVSGLSLEHMISFAELGEAMGSPAPDPPRDPKAPLSADEAAAMTAAMDTLGITHAVYTWRGPVRTPSHRYYYGFYRTDLADCFAAEKACAPGFELVATLPLPDDLERAPVRIYRRVR